MGHYLTNKEFLEFAEQQNRQIDYVDLLIPTFAGGFRGKRILKKDMRKLAAGQITMPLSTANMDVAGNTPLYICEGASDGDPDAVFLPIKSTLSIVAGFPTRAQVMLEYDSASLGKRGDYQNPRQYLQDILTLFEQENWHPQCAIELEFFLTNPERQRGELLKPLVGQLSNRELFTDQCLSITSLDEFAPFLETLYEMLESQNLTPKAISSEYSQGQFEVNQPHGTDILKICDKAALLKHTVKNVARLHGFEATFMAKPYADKPGSGMHIHCSLLDNNGDNIFAPLKKSQKMDDPVPLFAGSGMSEFSDIFKNAIGGVLSTGADFMAVFAPFANSYRRFKGGFFAPVNTAWGYNNRSAAIRIPTCFSSADVRFEHRIAGADANIYLAMASMLAGVHYGITEKISPPDISIGDDLIEMGPLPLRWGEALTAFKQSPICEKYFGHQRKDFLYQLSAAEYDAYHEIVPGQDFDRYWEHV